MMTKTNRLPGMEDKVVEAIEEKAEEIEDGVAKLKALRTKQATLNEAMITLLKENKLRVYTGRGLTVTIERGNEKVKVARDKEDAE